MKKNLLYIDVQIVSKKSLKEIIGGSTGCADGTTDGYDSGYDIGFDDGYDAATGG